MLWLLYTFALCELKISDVNIRLPISCDREAGRPYQIITCFSPNAILTPQSEDLIEIEILYQDLTSTVAKIIVKYGDPQPIATEVLVTDGEESTKITVNIDRIDHLQIISTANSLYVNSFCSIKVNAYNVDGLIFSSLNGTEIEWGPDTIDRPFDFYKLEDTPLKGLYETLPTDYNIIRPKRVALTHLTCKMIKRDATMANQPFRFVDPIIFEPSNLYMIQGSQSHLNLYYAIVVNNEIKPNENRVINLDSDYENFTIKSYTPLVAEVSENGHVDALSLGKTTVTARDKSLLSNVANAVIHVVIPNGFRWDEQWIKTGDQNTGPYAVGPFEPNISTIVLLYDNNTLIVPDHFEFKVSDDWKEIGTHSVLVQCPQVNYDFHGTVHTCPPPTVQPSYVRLPVGYNNYQFKILGGSGHFDFIYDDSLLLIDSESTQEPVEQEDGYILSTHSLSPLKEGEAVITIVDQKFEGYNTTLTIVTAYPYRINLVVNGTELLVGEKFTNYTAYVYDQFGNLFDNIQEVDIIPENTTILNEGLIATSPGFTTVHASIGNLKSNNVTIMVMDKLKVSSPLNGTSMTTLNMGRTGGPISWGNTPQINIITCDGAKFEFLDNFTLIKFLEDYEGICTLQVMNQPTADNPNPRILEANFRVTLEKLCYVAILPVDSDSNDVYECGLLMSTIDANENVETDYHNRVDHVRIPYKHHLELKLFAYGENNKRLGIYCEPGSDIVLSTHDGNESIYHDPFAIETDLNATIHIKDNLPIIPLQVDVVYPHRTREPNPFSLYKKNIQGAEAHIIHGCGPFNVEGEGVQLIDNRVLHIDPSFKPIRTVLITDRCIPENNYSIDVQTFSIGSLEIEGPDQAIVGDRLEFTPHLITPDGKTLPSEFYDQIVWQSNPRDNLTYNNETGKWEITVTKPGRLELILIADDIRRSHPLVVFEKILPKKDHITMFVGETLPIEFDGLDKDRIKIDSSDPEIVSFGNNLIATAHKPGIVNATAYFPDYPGFDKVNITIHVLEAKRLILECNKTNLETGDPVYVGSYVHVVPYIETDIGLLPPKTIKWQIDGSDSWEKLYDHSIMIQGEKEGTVVITASSINDLQNQTRIYYDYKLKLTNPGHIKIPVGSTYDVKPIDDLQNVTYEIAPYNCLHKVSGVTINETGTIHAGSEGRYVVIVNYKNQWEAIPLTITKPSKVYLQSEATQIVHPRVFDTDYQEYSPFNGSTVTFSPKFEYVNYDGHYTFDIPPDDNIEPILVDANVSIDPLWLQSHSALLFPRKNIYPQNPIVQKGAQLQFKCQAAKPNYHSVNPRVATISNSGLLTAHKEGKTLVQCTPEIETSVVVVSFESVTLKKVKEHLYKVEGHFIPQNAQGSSLFFSDDISYRYKWDATECGYTQDVIENGEHYCKLVFYDRHLCPEHSILTVNVESPKTGINLVGETDVFLKNTYFLITPIVTVGIAPDQKVFEFDLKRATQNSSLTDDISYELPPNVNLTWDDTKSKVKLHFFKGFKGGPVIFEHNDPPYERVKLILQLDNSSWASSFFNPSPQRWDPYVLIGSIIITILMAIYVFTSLNEGDLLPPYSPYQVKNKKKRN